MTVGGEILNFAGYAGASKIRTNTVLGYNWGDSRVSLTWLFRKGTEGLLTTNRPSPTLAGYPANNLFNLSGGTRLGPVDVIGGRQQPVQQGTGRRRLFHRGRNGWLWHVRSLRGDQAGRRGTQLSFTMAF